MSTEAQQGLTNRRKKKHDPVRWVEFGTILRQLRISFNRRVKDVGDFLGVNPLYVSMWELGRRATPIDIVDKLAAYYAVEPGFLRAKMPKPAMGVRTKAKALMEAPPPVVPGATVPDVEALPSPKLAHQTRYKPGTYPLAQVVQGVPISGPLETPAPADPIPEPEVPFPGARRVPGSWEPPASPPSLPDPVPGKQKATALDLALLQRRLSR